MAANIKSLLIRPKRPISPSGCSAELAPVVRTGIPRLLSCCPARDLRRLAASRSFSLPAIKASPRRPARALCVLPSGFAGNCSARPRAKSFMSWFMSCNHMVAGVVAMPRRRERPAGSWKGSPTMFAGFFMSRSRAAPRLRRRNFAAARYDASYRITANFLNWTVGKFGDEVVTKLNAAAREGRYDQDIWSELTGSTLPELGSQWKTAVEREVGQREDSDDEAAESINILTSDEKAAGWKLLFNGRNLDGWHTFRRDDVRPGWQVQDGALVSPTHTTLATFARTKCTAGLSCNSSTTSLAAAIVE